MMNLLHFPYSRPCNYQWGLDMTILVALTSRMLDEETVRDYECFWVTQNPASLPKFNMTTQCLHCFRNQLSANLHLRPLLFKCNLILFKNHLHCSSKSPPIRCFSVVINSTCPPRASKSTQLRSFHAEAVVVQKDEKYGNKQIISVTPQLYDYILTNVREPEILRKLREETATMCGSQMQVSPDQAQLLAMLVQIHGAQRCIEVGVYTGYSSLAVALVLPESGRLVACERDVKSLEIAKKYYEMAGVSHKVDVRHALAVDTLRSLIGNGEACSYDFAFVDAEKRVYHEYFELLLKLVRVGGVIVIDNVLWHGKVADTSVNDPKTVSIRNFNKSIMEDERVTISMVPIGDGMTICRKR